MEYNPERGLEIQEYGDAYSTGGNYRLETPGSRKAMTLAQQREYWPFHDFEHPDKDPGVREYWLREALGGSNRSAQACFEERAREQLAKGVSIQEAILNAGREMGIKTRDPEYIGLPRWYKLLKKGHDSFHATFAELTAQHADTEPPAALCRDSAQSRLLTAGDTVWLYGPPGIGKTWAALALAASAAQAGAHVAYVAYERDSDVRRRLAACEQADWPGRCLIIPGQPAERQFLHIQAWLSWADTSLVVHDSAYKAGFDGTANPQTEGRQQVALWAGQDTRRTSLIVDHSARRHEGGQAPGPAGSYEKVADADVAYLADSEGDEGGLTAVKLTAVKRNHPHNPRTIDVTIRDGVASALARTRTLDP